MTSPIRATAILAAASAATVASGIVTGKAYALLVGPAGFGQYALLRSTLSLAALVAGLGVGVILVRVIAERGAAGDTAAVVAARKAGRIVGLAGGVLTAVIMSMAATPLARLFGIDPEAFALLGPATVLTVAAGIETATLNGHHRVTALAIVTTLTAVSGAAASVLAVVLLGTPGIALGLLIGAAAGLVASLVAVRIATPMPVEPDSASYVTMMRQLVGAGIPYTASSLAGTGAQLALPLVVGILASEAEVGFYRAASAVSIGYLGFLLRAMGQDYYPRIAAATATPELVPGVIKEQLKLLMALSTPIIFLSLALAGPLVTILYSPDFAPAAHVLQWQLAGDLLKLPAWTLSFVVLASGRSLSILGLELVGGVTLVGSTLLGLAIVGLTGAGAAYLVTYAVYYPVAYWLASRHVTIRPSRLLLLPVAMAAIVAVLAIVDSAVAVSWLAPLGYGVMAAVATFISLRHLRRAVRPRARWFSGSGGSR